MISEVEIRRPPWCSLSFWVLICKSSLSSRDLVPTWDCQVGLEMRRKAAFDEDAIFPGFHTLGLCVKFNLLSGRQSVWPHLSCWKTDFQGQPRDKTNEPLVLGGRLQRTGEGGQAPGSSVGHTGHGGRAQAGAPRSFRAHLSCKQMFGKHSRQSQTTTPSG